MMPFDLNHAYLMNALSNAGGYLAIGFAAIGSAYGAGVAGLAAISAWKKCYVQNRPAPFLLVALAGMPLSQTIYGMILMMVMRGKVQAAAEAAQAAVAAGETVAAEIQAVFQLWPFYLIMGIAAGIGCMFSSFWQGKTCAYACDAYGETGKGFANYIMVAGVIETVSIFVLVFALMVI
jgi:V/A-type H+-transporting ATPase subunit K